MPALEVRRPPVTSLIDMFSDDYAWLSNFDPSPVTLDGIRYPTAEAAFQALKTTDRALRQQIADAPSPAKAKYLGRSLRLRHGWNDIRNQAMDEVLARKFSTPDLARLLIGTGDALLVEGNYHHDNYWGWCQCSRHREYPGQNRLGLALMKLRAKLQHASPDRWTRVAATGHRPHKIPRELRGWAQQELARVAAKLVTQHHMDIAISGLARGADIWWAQATREAGARVWGYSPCPEQDRKWSQVWKNQRQQIMNDAERVAHLGATYHFELLGRRNRWMVHDAQALVALVDSTRTDGGTIATIRYATGRIPIIRIDLHTREVRLVRPRPVVTSPGEDLSSVGLV